MAAFALALRGLGDDTKDVRVAKASGASKAALKGKGMLRLAYRETRRVTLGASRTSESTLWPRSCELLRAASKEIRSCEGCIANKITCYKLKRK